MVGAASAASAPSSSLISAKREARVAGAGSVPAGGDCVDGGAVDEPGGAAAGGDEVETCWLGDPVTAAKLAATCASCCVTGWLGVWGIAACGGGGEAATAAKVRFNPQVAHFTLGYQLVDWHPGLEHVHRRLASAAPVC